MSQRNKSARYSDQTKRAEMRSSIEPKYITPLAVIGGAILAYPVIDTLTNITALNFAAMAALLFAVSIAAGCVVENERCR